MEIVGDEAGEGGDVLTDAGDDEFRQEVAAVAAEVRLVGEGRADVRPEGGPELFAGGPLVDERNFFLRGKFTHGARPRADGVAVGATLHRSDKDEGGAAAARLCENHVEVGFEGGAGLGVALRPLRFGVVVAELDEEKVAGFHLAEDFVEAVAGDETLGGFAALGGVAEGDFGFEKLAELRGPVAAGAATRIADGGIAGREERGHAVVLHDLEGGEAGARAVEFEGELFVPVARLGFAREKHVDDAAAGGVGRGRRELGPADVGVEGARHALAGGRRDAGRHDVAGLGAYRGIGFAGGIAERDGNAVVALGDFDGKEKRCIHAGLGAEVEAVAQFGGVKGVGGDGGVGGGGGLGGRESEREFEFGVDGRRWWERFVFGARLCEQRRSAEHRQTRGTGKNDETAGE